MTKAALDFWNYPDWRGDGRDNPRSPTFDPFWMRPPALPKPARPTLKRNPKVIGKSEGTETWSGISIKMPAGLSHVKVPCADWAYLVIRASGALYQGAVLSIPDGPKAGVYLWTGNLWEEVE